MTAQRPTIDELLDAEVGLEELAQRYRAVKDGEHPSDWRLNQADAFERVARWLNHVRLSQ